MAESGPSTSLLRREASVGGLSVGSCVEDVDWADGSVTPRVSPVAAAAVISATGAGVADDGTDGSEGDGTNGGPLPSSWAPSPGLYPRSQPPLLSPRRAARCARENEFPGYEDAVDGSPFTEAVEGRHAPSAPVRVAEEEEPPPWDRLRDGKGGSVSPSHPDGAPANNGAADSGDDAVVVAAAPPSSTRGALRRRSSRVMGLERADLAASAAAFKYPALEFSGGACGRERDCGCPSLSVPAAGCGWEEGDGKDGAEESGADRHRRRPPKVADERSSERGSSSGADGASGRANASAVEKEISDVVNAGWGTAVLLSPQRSTTKKSREDVLADDVRHSCGEAEMMASQNNEQWEVEVEAEVDAAPELGGDGDCVSTVGDSEALDGASMSDDEKGDCEDGSSKGVHDTFVGKGATMMIPQRATKKGRGDEAHFASGCCWQHYKEQRKLEMEAEAEAEVEGLELGGDGAGICAARDSETLDDAQVPEDGLLKKVGFETSAARREKKGRGGGRKKKARGEGGTCGRLGCDNCCYQMGLCRKHYKELKLGPCQISGCDQPPFAKGVCWIHYKKQRKGKVKVGPEVAFSEEGLRNDAAVGEGVMSPPLSQRTKKRRGAGGKKRLLDMSACNKPPLRMGEENCSEKWKAAREETDPSAVAAKVVATSTAALVPIARKQGRPPAQYRCSHPRCSRWREYEGLGLCRVHLPKVTVEEQEVVRFGAGAERRDGMDAEEGCHQTEEQRAPGTSNDENEFVGVDTDEDAHELSEEECGSDASKSVGQGFSRTMSAFTGQLVGTQCHSEGGNKQHSVINEENTPEVAADEGAGGAAAEEAQTASPQRTKKRKKFGRETGIQPVGVLHGESLSALLNGERCRSFKCDLPCKARELCGRRLQLSCVAKPEDRGLRGVNGSGENVVGVSMAASPKSFQCSNRSSFRKRHPTSFFAKETLSFMAQTVSPRDAKHQENIGKKLCSVSGCGRAHLAKGLCSGHLQQRWSAGKKMSRKLGEASSSMKIEKEEDNSEISPRAEDDGSVRSSRWSGRRKTPTKFYVHDQDSSVLYESREIPGSGGPGKKRRRAAMTAKSSPSSSGNFDIMSVPNRRQSESTDAAADFSSSSLDLRSPNSSAMPKSVLESQSGEMGGTTTVDDALDETWVASKVRRKLLEDDVSSASNESTRTLDSAPYSRKVCASLPVPGGGTVKGYQGSDEPSDTQVKEGENDESEELSFGTEEESSEEEEDFEKGVIEDGEDSDTNLDRMKTESPRGVPKSVSGNPPQAEEEGWVCYKCGCKTIVTRKRCRNCRSWKGGVRSGAKRKNENEAGVAKDETPLLSQRGQVSTPKLTPNPKKISRQVCSQQHNEELPDEGEEEDEPGLSRRPFDIRPFRDPHRKDVCRMWKALDKGRPTFRSFAPPPLLPPLPCVSTEMRQKKEERSSSNDAAATSNAIECRTEVVTVVPQVSPRHNFNVILCAVQARVNAGMTDAAKQLCRDTLRDWYLDAQILQDQAKVSLRSLNNDVKTSRENSAAELSRLGQNLAGLWCVYAQLLLDIEGLKKGAKKKKTEKNSINGILGAPGGRKESAGRGRDHFKGHSCSSPQDQTLAVLAVLEDASSCPLAGRCAWPWLARSTLLLQQSADYAASPRTVSEKNVHKNAVLGRENGCHNGGTQDEKRFCHESSHYKEAVEMIEKGLFVMTSRRRSSLVNSTEDKVLFRFSSIGDLQLMDVASLSKRLDVDELGARKLCNEMNQLIIELEQHGTTSDGKREVKDTGECVADVSVMHSGKESVEKSKSFASTSPTNSFAVANGGEKGMCDFVEGVDERSGDGAVLRYARTASNLRNGTHLKSLNIGNEKTEDVLSTGVAAPIFSTRFCNSKESEETRPLSKSTLKSRFASLIAECTLGESDVLCGCREGARKKYCSLEWACSTCPKTFETDRNLKQHEYGCKERHTSTFLGSPTSENKDIITDTSSGEFITPRVFRTSAPVQRSMPCEPFYTEDEAMDVLDYLVEFFSVSEGDFHLLVKSRGRVSSKQKQGVVDSGTKKLSSSAQIPKYPGQLGIRCLFCRDVESIAVRNSAVFPESVKDLRNALWRLQISHLESCCNIPKGARRRYEEFRNTVHVRSTKYIQYWMRISREYGLRNDCKHGGIKCRPKAALDASRNDVEDDACKRKVLQTVTM